MFGYLIRNPLMKSALYPQYMEFSPGGDRMQHSWKGTMPF